MALLKRAMADIPRIEQLEKDHPRMARLFQKGLLPFGIWEQLVDAESIMDTEVSQATLIEYASSQRLVQRSITTENDFRTTLGTHSAERSGKATKGLGARRV